jgi:hypothetical protein
MNGVWSWLSCIGTFCPISGGEVKTFPNWALPLLLIIALALAVSIGVIAMVAFRPVQVTQPGAVQVQNIFTTIDGTPVVILNGEVIFSRPFVTPTPEADK